MELMCTMVLVKQTFVEPELAVGSVRNPKKIFVQFDGSGERTNTKLLGKVPGITLGCSA